METKRQAAANWRFRPSQRRWPKRFLQSGRFRRTQEQSVAHVRMVTAIAVANKGSAARSGPARETPMRVKAS